MTPAAPPGARAQPRAAPREEQGAAPICPTGERDGAGAQLLFPAPEARKEGRMDEASESSLFAGAGIVPSQILPVVPGPAEMEQRGEEPELIPEGTGF